MKKEILYRADYQSPLGEILLVSDGTHLVGLYLEGQKYYFKDPQQLTKQDSLPIFQKTKDWLDRYFRGENPTISELALSPRGTEFQNQVWALLQQIPYGQTTTYGTIAKVVAQQRNRKTMSSQAVGNAVGHNPISILIPCHRVIGKNGELTGYAGGLMRKEYLLKLESRGKINSTKVQE